ncbi:MAG TPA: apolipoprotein N-acyltransferase, partial [Ignavibacteria bacterium]|nr:apolipoprotein N-acyltransferase [Ignavibacteria bacterium]
LLIPLAGIFFALSFPPVDLNYLIFISFVIIIHIFFRTKNFKSAFIRSYMIFFTACIISVSWIMLSGMRDNADRFLIIGGIFILLVYPLFFVMPLLVFYKIKSKFTFRFGSIFTLILFPVVWTGFEYISTIGQINFPWLFAGNTLTYNPAKIQYAEITGIFGVSFWVCCISVMLYVLYRNIFEVKIPYSSFKNISVLVCLILLYFFPDFYNSSLSDFKKITGSSHGKIKTGIIQPNINPWLKWGGKQDELVSGYAEQIRDLYISNPDIELIILPETALPYFFREKYFEEKFLILKNLCDSIQIPILIGTPDLEYYENPDEAPVDAKIMRSTGKKYDTYNTAVLFEPEIDKNEYQKHQKVKLVIGSERMPYQELLPFTKSLIEWGVGLGSWQIGKDTNNFTLKNNVTFNTAVCYESVYPEFFADFVKKGADFSVIITNDGWWGKFFGTYQHNQFAVFRAIENRRWIARCANTGISDFISPYGEIFQHTEIDEKTSIVREIDLISETTFYTKHGDAPAEYCLYLSLLIFGICFFIKNEKKSAP